MANYLEDIFFKGEAIKPVTFEVGDKKVTVELATLSQEHQNNVDSVMAAMPEDSTNVQLAHKYMIEVLTHTLRSVDGEKFADFGSCREYILKRPTIFLKALSKKQSAFEQEIKSLLGDEQLDANFSEAPQPETESKQK